MAQKIQWIDDAYGVTSLHTNEPSKMHEESKLGEIVRQGDQFFFKRKGVEKLEGPFKNISETKAAAVRLVDGEYV